MATRVDINQLPDPALIVGADGIIIAANSQALALFGYAVLEGFGIEHLVAIEARDRHVVHRERYNQAPRQRPMSTGAPLVARLASGELAYVEISLGPLGGGRTLALIRNATARIRNEQEYRETRTKLIEVLEQVNQVLRDDLRDLVERVERLETAEHQSSMA